MNRQITRTQILIGFALLELIGCDSKSSATTSAPISKTTKVMTNENSTNTEIAKSYNQNTSTEFHVTNVNTAKSSEKNAIVNQIKSKFIDTAISASSMTKSNGKTLLMGDLLSLSGGLIDKDHIATVNIVNNKDVVAIKNTFSRYVQDWYRSGESIRITGMDYCGKSITIQSGYHLNGWFNQTGGPTYYSTTDNMLWFAKAEPTVDYDNGYDPNAQKPFKAIVYYMDSRYATSLQRTNGTCVTDNVYSEEDLLFQNEVYGLNFGGEADAGTWIESSYTYTNIVRAFLRDFSSSNSGCPDIESYYRRIISHELGHFFISHYHDIDNQTSLMYLLTKCTASTVLPVNINEMSPTLFSEFSLFAPYSGIQRWIP